MKTAIELLKQDIDSEIKLGTKLVVNWDMYLEIEKQQIKEAVLNQVTTHPRFRKIFEEQFEKYYNETYGK